MAEQRVSSSIAQVAYTPSSAVTRVISDIVQVAYIPAPELTSYANPGGTGDRNSLITVSTTIVPHPVYSQPTPEPLIDGSYAQNITNSWDWDSQAIAGLELKFYFNGDWVVINEAKWYQVGATYQGEWKWQGSDDGTSWTDIGGVFSLGTSATQTLTELSGNATPYYYYRLLGVSNSSSSSVYLEEIEFKISLPQELEVEDAAVTGSAGIASLLAFGTAGLVTTYGGPLIGVTGISSALAFGIGTVEVVIEAQAISGDTGIPSEEAFGEEGTFIRGIWGGIGIPSGEAFGNSGAVLAIDYTNSNFAMFIAGVDVSHYLQVGTLRIDRQLNFQDAAQFSIIDEAGSYFPVMGKEVVMYYSHEGTAVRIFGGQIETLESIVDAAGHSVFFNVQCTDYGRALSRRILNMSYPAIRYGTLSSILQDIQDRILTAEKISWVNLGSTDIVVGDIDFSYVPLTEVFDKLSELTGLVYRTDYFRNFSMFDRSMLYDSAPFDITQETSGPNGEIWADLHISQNKGLYRNRQYLRNTFTQTSTTVTKTYTCDFSIVAPPSEFSSSWTLISEDGGANYYAPYFTDGEFANRVYKVTSFKRNDVDEPFFVQGAGATSGFKWMQINAKSLDFIFNLFGFPEQADRPKLGDTLTISFEVLNELPASVVEENADEILARSIAEGNTGLYEAVDELVDVQDPDLVVAYAQNLLAKFSVPSIEASFSTVKYGLSPGQEIILDIPSLGHNSVLMTVEGMTLQEESKTILRNSVKISNQIQQRDALSAFQRLVRKLRKPAARQLQTITFTLALTYPGVANPGLVVGNNLTNAYIVRQDITLKEVTMYFKTPPTGSSIRIDIRVDGVSIFPLGFMCDYPVSQTGLVSYTTFAAPGVLPKGSLVTIDVTQIGSDETGKDGTVVLTGWVTASPQRAPVIEDEGPL